MVPFWIQNVTIIKGEAVLYTSCRHLYELLFFLRNHTNALYHTIPDITAIDYPENKQRFEVVYNLLSPFYNHRIRIKTLVDEITPLPSLMSVYDGTN